MSDDSSLTLADMLMAPNAFPQTLRVLFVRDMPAAAVNCAKFPTLVVSRNCQLPGLMSEILKLLTDHLNSTIVSHVLDTSLLSNNSERVDLGRITDTKIDGLLGQLYSNEVDTLAIGVQSTELRTRYFSFSDPLYTVEANVFHRQYEDQLNSLWAFFTVYRVGLLLDIVASAIFNMFSACQLRRDGMHSIYFIVHQYAWSSSYQVSCTEIMDAAWKSVQLQLGQSLNIRWIGYSIKFNVIVVSMFQAVVLLGIYSSYSLSQKLTRVENANIDGNKELIVAIKSKSRYFTSSTASDWFYENLNMSNAYPYKDLRDAIKNNPIRISKSERESIEDADRGEGLVIIQNDQNAALVLKEFCALVPMDEPIAEVSARLVFKLGSPLVSAVNAAIGSNRVELQRIVRKYQDFIKRNDRKCRRQQSRINLPYFGLSIMWSGATGCAILLLFIEIGVNLVIRQRWRRSAAAAR